MSSWNNFPGKWDSDELLDLVLDDESTLVEKAQAIEELTSRKIQGEKVTFHYPVDDEYEQHAEPRTRDCGRVKIIKRAIRQGFRGEGFKDPKKAMAQAIADIERNSSMQGIDGAEKWLEQWKYHYSVWKRS